MAPVAKRGKKNIKISSRIKNVNHSLTSLDLDDMDNTNPIGNCENLETSDLNPNIAKSMWALDNPLIVNSILQHLDLQSLKEARKVNSTWKKEGTNILKKKTRIHVEVGRPFKKPAVLTSQNRKPLATRAGGRGYRYKHSEINSSAHLELARFPVQNLKISWPKLDADIATKEKAKKTSVSLLSVLDELGPQIKHLELDLLNSQVLKIDPEFDMKVLSKVKTLNHLHLNISCSEDEDIKHDLKFWKNFTLPKLDCQSSVKRLQLDANYFPIDGMEICQVIFEKLKDLFPNVQELIVTTASPEVDLQILCRFQSCSNITKLIVNEEVSMDVIRKISEKTFMIHLSCLHLQLPTVTVNDRHDIEKMFIRFAPRLTELCLIVYHSFWDDMDQPQSPLEISLPSFPKLRKFTIIPEGFYTNRWTEELNLIIKFKFLTDRLDYAIQFPMLQKLTLGRNNKEYFYSEGDGFWEHYLTRWKCFQVFLPQADENQVVQNILHLDVPFANLKYLNVQEIEEFYRECGFFVLEIMEHLGKCFPNARMPYSNYLQDCAKLNEKMKKLLPAAE